MGRQLLLKMAFYLVAGVLLSSITWSTLSHSAVTDDYVLSVILLGMMFYVAGKFFVDRWRPDDREQDFHATKLWKFPYETTRNGLWRRVAFSTAANLAVFSILASLLVLATTAHPAFMVLLGTLFLLRIPHLYWSMRVRYEPVYSVDADSVPAATLRYAGGARIPRRVRWLFPIGMAGVGTTVAVIATMIG